MVALAHPASAEDTTTTEPEVTTTTTEPEVTTTTTVEVTTTTVDGESGELEGQLSLWDDQGRPSTGELLLFMALVSLSAGAVFGRAVFR